VNARDARCGGRAETAGEPRGSLESIVIAIKDDLYKLAIRMLASRVEAEDATQEIRSST